MNELTLIAETAGRLFGETCTTAVLEAAEQGEWTEIVWDALEQTGLHLISVPEAVGGVGGSLNEAVTVLRIAAQHAAPLPLAEIYLAGWLLGEAGIGLPNGRFTLAIPRPTNDVAFAETAVGWQLAGELTRIAFARHVGFAIVVVAGRVGLVDLADATLIPSQNLAEEPRDTAVFAQTKLLAVSESLAPEVISHLPVRGALLRTAQMVGALEAILACSIRYVGEREQFGRPIAKFQAIQQYMAQLAGEVVAAKAALETAVMLVEQEGQGAKTAVAMAKIRVGEAVSTATRIAHQIHGAMGFTQEYPLHYFTKRLWAWRDEFGAEGEWAEWLGKEVLKMKAQNLWPFVVG